MGSLLAKFAEEISSSPRSGLAGKIGLKKKTYHAADHEKKASYGRLEVAFSDMSSPLSLSETSKSATADDTVHESEEDARKRRLGELLRRRQHTGLDTGSATPNPPRDNR